MLGSRIWSVDSIPKVCIICGFAVLLVLYSAPKFFSARTAVFHFYLKALLVRFALCVLELQYSDLVMCSTNII